MIESYPLGDGVFTLAEFFSPAECEAAIRTSEQLGFDEAPINTALGPQVHSEVRNNQRVMLDDPARADDLWSRVKDFVPASLGEWWAVGVNERFRFYRYDVGQQFDWHLDGYFERANGQRSHLTFMVYLNDDFEGGETSFDGFRIRPARGTALLFVHRQWHKGEPVQRGRKYVLRTDVMYQR